MVTAVSDAIPPQCSITAPAEGSYVEGTTEITADATDNIGVERVEFYIDGNLKSTDTTSPYSYSWDTTAESDGSHSIEAKAYDAADNVGSDSITVTVDNNPPVSFDLVSPPNGSTTSFSPLFSWSASSDAGSGLAKYQLYIDGSLNKDNIPPSSLSSKAATPLSRGIHTWHVKAVDSLGKVTNSSSTGAI